MLKELDDYELENRKKNDDYNDDREYRKKKKSGKIKKWSMIMVIICLLFTIIAFKNGKILRALIGIMQIALFGYTFLLCLEVLSEKIKNLYKLTFIGGLILIIPFFMIGNSAGSSNYEEAGTIDLSKTKLAEHLPMPDKQYGRINFDRNDLLDFDICDISKEDFEGYVKKTENKGYTIDLDDDNWDTSYRAFDKDGYSIYIEYYESEEEYSVSLEVPEEMDNFEWPTSGPGSLIPATKSLYGRIYSNDSDSFGVHVGNTTIDDFNEYVKSCEAQGFNIDFSKGDRSYNAYNAAGYELDLTYLGANVIEVSIESPEDSSEETTESTEEESTDTNDTTTTDSNGLRSDFKEAMDSYEAVMNEYVEFMKKYNANPSDKTLLSEYYDYLTKYNNAIEAFDKWESEDLNDAETKYYLEVQTRINKKLLEIQ